ncbi:efflux RND transporter periplasmic adaptor subunit [Desulfovibrio cuneatus]|uniref:efflux RND transporter periplasmic adaptor subunit n=1 Tax=Desulfovibrio cuneatus TaxID=159728 RepID=UPI0004148B89|nr:efflux RND transporter periplasmic adaptor subunit [Desulfovibrio cuneatus]
MLHIANKGSGFSWVRGLLFSIAIVAVGLAWRLFGPTSNPQQQEERPQPVRVGTAVSKVIPVYLQAIGTVVPANTALVRSRVDGPLEKVFFEEGQLVQEGDMLAQIDPKPFEVKLAQVQGALATSQAQLRGAELDLERYKKLIKEGSVSTQQLQGQEALVGQYRGNVQVYEANLADARLQLSYTSIKAPISGRAGLKKTDVGNMVRAADATGIVVITQTDPMFVTFSIVERELPEVLAAHNKAPLTVEAWGQGNQTLLATGTLSSVDNQIDPTTGTVKAKAAFANVGTILFPNQFVNVRLLVRTQENALVIPSSAVQRDNEGFFVFGVGDIVAPEAGEKAAPAEKQAPAAKMEKAGNGTQKPPQPRRSTGTVTPRKIRTGYATSTETIVLEGLAPGDVVVVDGVDRLREDAKVLF